MKQVSNMYQPKIILSALLMFSILLSACSREIESDLLPEQSATNEPVEEPGADFARQLTGTFSGHCCQHLIDDDEHFTYEATNEVVLSDENSSDLIIDGQLFFHVSGLDKTTESILYRSVEGYGAEVTFRKDGTIMSKDVSYSTPDESGTINCDTYKEDGN